MTVRCINDTFPEDYRKFYEIHKVVTPYLDCVYTIRNVVHTRWGVGFHLEELKNPLVPLYGEGEDQMKSEPNWNIQRFVNIDGSKITNQQLENFKDEISKQKEVEY